ncbi:sigma-54-dependent transcriptional regulator [Methylomagnum ishizawai]|uniref:sigma-54-dependent transcriptional regulator n=1 Tax=Methylomagnum ishizawai TaxID=1760988 RepID=UPI001C33A942|nr:sigma-54 dependent transcriptional regulator [Methylomagnum ishizawai]BBL74095.1 acetoacetate metabolism regulatory protein AtoC [Methylomagnum ishizawai]
MNHSRVLVVDDEANARRMLEILLARLGCQVLTAADGQEALDILHGGAVHLVVTDLNMPRMDGLGLLAALRQEGNPVPVILVTAYGTVETAVAAMKQGAFDYLIRPLDLDQVELVVRRALDRQRIVRENLFLRGQMDRGWEEFVGQGAAMRQVYELIRQVAPTKANVLVTGETGTGKELAARAIHRHSGREGLFVPINCAAIPAEILESELFGYAKGAFTGANKDRVGKFELADGGTLFLDEITEMSPALQAKLLRVLQESTIDRLGCNRPISVDIRIVAATNRDPRESVREGRLREDLFYRLNVFGIQLPPLRERREDIPALAAHFLEKYGTQLGCGGGRLDPAAERSLLAYPWPGNVRELENMMERAAVLCRGGTVEPRHLPLEIAGTVVPSVAAPVAASAGPEAEDLDLEQRVEALERRLLTRALAESGDNKAKAARLLKISERTLWYKLKKYGFSGEKG